MATTSSIRVAGKALTGQRGNRAGGHYGLKSKVLAGVVILGCAATLAFGGLRAAHQAPSRPAADASASQASVSVVAPQSVPLPNNSYDDLIWRLENAVGERVNGPAAGGPFGQAGTLSGGSYQDLIWELEVAIGERVNPPTATAK